MTIWSAFLISSCEMWSSGHTIYIRPIHPVFRVKPVVLAIISSREINSSALLPVGSEQNRSLPLRQNLAVPGWSALTLPMHLPIHWCPLKSEIRRYIGSCKSYKKEIIKKEEIAVTRIPHWLVELIAQHLQLDKQTSGWFHLSWCDISTASYFPSNLLIYLS